MRSLPALLIVASALFDCACSSTSTSSAAQDGAISTVPDVVLVNACLAYGPTGSVCKGGGLCGLGFTSQGQYLCASSTEVCCAPLTTGAQDSSVDGGGPVDATVADATLHDAGHDAAHDSSSDAARDTGAPDVVTATDGGHEAAIDAGHDAGHDAAGDAAHDATHDAGTKMDEAGDDAAHHEAGSDAAPDAKPG